MAFNLNKNDANNSSTKFDLSKTSPTPGTSVEQKKSKSKTWLWTLLGLLVIGTGAWYLLSGSNDPLKKDNDAVSSTVTDTISGSPTASNENKATASPVYNTENMQPENNSASTTSVKSNNSDANMGNNTSANPPATANVSSINNKVPATFAKGTNSISTVDESLVNAIITYLEKNPASNINVSGYASSEGTLAVNQQISQARADAFKKYLISKGITSNRINSTGRGIENPISSNDTEEGRIKNRRVEISIQ